MLNMIAGSGHQGIMRTLPLLLVASATLVASAVSQEAAAPAAEGDHAGEEDCPEFVCPEGEKGNGNFADPCNCRRFYTCSSGTATRTVCPTGLYWDDERKFCTYKNEAKCGPVERVERPHLEKLPRCDSGACQLPFCYCSRDGVLGPLPLDDKGALEASPQIVLLMFDGAVNTNNYRFYDQLLKHANPNVPDCEIHGTFFVTHNYNNYQMVEEFYGRGNDIAVSSVTGASLQFANASTWKTEVTVMRQLLRDLANVPEEDVLGARAPGLRPGFDEQFKAYAPLI